MPAVTAARRKKALPTSRRRRDDDDESVATEESYSDDSGISEISGESADEETEGEDEEVPVNGKMTDTEAMKNGIEGKNDNEVGEDFEELGKPKEAVLEIRPTQETPYERRRREHEEYKKRRAEDPAFVPNRGRFFMHDQRFDGNGFRRGRGGRFGDMHHSHQTPPELAVDKWGHDMHEQVERQPPQPPQQPANRPRAPPLDQPRSFGKTLHKGTVQIQVNLAGMKAPITFSEVPWKSYTRLPYHRPPLRRDKPVRIALPDAPVRYIYPSVARSFIFIPRAMRPGGSGYIRGAGGRGRGGYPTGPGRSMYGGGSTIYSPSVDMSRRSSLQFDTRHQTPAIATASAAIAAPPQQPQNYVPSPQTRPPIEDGGESARPIVRLPSATPSHHSAPPQASTPRITTVPHPPPPSYTPSIPYRETRATPKIPMYQPRPQKAVNVAEIDSPHVVHFPQNYSGGVYHSDLPPSSTPNGHFRHPSYPSQTSGTPLSQIPEAPRPFYPQHHIPPQPHFYPQPYPTYQPYQSVPPPPPYAAASPQQGQTIAQESNGMVYYTTWDPNAAMYASPPQQPAAYHQPYPITPDQGAVYYYPPPQQQQGPQFFGGQG